MHTDAVRLLLPLVVLLVEAEAGVAGAPELVSARLARLLAQAQAARVHRLGDTSGRSTITIFNIILSTRLNRCFSQWTAKSEVAGLNRERGECLCEEHECLYLGLGSCM